ncbi:hypothetical protein OKW21_000554 [Catalinimonas alkaloidigena]|uniref:hypothetical protein n=1 Tax=Catalinimonas alkaloidigena TaxID=1075417 RepID=UPI002406076E|nr:hypothetical protein [Catalinimonas alkaloidigena]MDF9795291.1 hypothetical protein [Catalinimonas alkaloidigena]
MMDNGIQIRELSFIDEKQDRLTINAQEALKERLLSQARERALDDEGKVNSPIRVSEYYYDELASFMKSYPSVYIDLILIKLEKDKLN